MTSITLDLFSGKDRKIIPVSVPTISLADYTERLSAFVQKMQCEKYFPFNRHNVVCREIFQNEEQQEGFCFPSTVGRHISLNLALANNFFFLRNGPKWNFIFVFVPQEGSKDIAFCNTPLKFPQEDGYPQGANSKTFFSLSVSCISLLVSEHGRIITNSDGQPKLQGIAASLLQTSISPGKYIFFQKKEIIVSPNSPLREGYVENINLSGFVKINCFCRQKNFFYSTHIPVLTSKELEERLRSNAADRLMKYGPESMRYKHSSGTQFVPALKAPVSSCLIVFPPGMELDVPFDSSRGGELFFSYSAEPIPDLKVIFFPILFDKNQPLQKRHSRCGKNWHIESSTPLILFSSGLRASVYSLPNASLVSCSSLEHEIIGMKIELDQTPQGSFWGVFCSTGKNTDCSAGNLVPLPFGVRPHFKSRKKVARLFPFSKPVATVFVPPKTQGKHRQRDKRPFSSDLDSHVQQGAGAGGASFFGAHRGMIGHSHHSQATSTVSVPPERQSSSTGSSDRMDVVQISSVARNYPYARGELKQQAQQGGRKRLYVMFFPPLASVINKPVMDFDPLSSEASQQGVEPLQMESVIVSRGVGAPPRASVIVSQGVGLPPRASVIVSQGVGLPPRASVIVSQGVGLPPRASVIVPQGIRLPQRASIIVSQGVGLPQRASVIVPQGIGLPPRANVIVSQGVEPSPRENVTISVGSVQQRPLWKPYE